MREAAEIKLLEVHEEIVQAVVGAVYDRAFPAFESEKVSLTRPSAALSQRERARATKLGLLG
jgi:hypothetical protein